MFVYLKPIKYEITNKRERKNNEKKIVAKYILFFCDKCIIYMKYNYHVICMTYCLIKMNNEEKELDILVSYYQYRYSVQWGNIIINI